MSPRVSNALAPLALLAITLQGCGGNAPSSPAAVVVTPTPTPTPTATCTLRARQDWAAAAINEWYLFPETLPASLDPAPYATVSDYIDALTATARAQSKDRYFTYITSIAEEDAYYASGATAAFGIRIVTDGAARTVTVADAYEGAPALAAGIDRGTEILGLGPTPETIVSVDQLIAAGGNALTAAFGPSDAGVTRSFRIRDAAGTRVVTATKADFAIQPVSPRFGTRVIEADGQRIGYLNLRTFIGPTEAQLRTAFAEFRGQGISRFIIDLRYNGGGLVSQAQTMADLLGRDRLPQDVVNYVSYRPSKSNNNQTRLFRAQAEAVAPARIAFIATGSTASASELVINSFTPFLKADVILVGANTFGKPVGQIAIDRAACDDRLRITAFETQNADRQGNYYRGLATTVGASCAAEDMLALPMGDPREGSTRVALDALAGRSCTPIAVDSRALALREARRDPLLPETPSAAQLDLPGTF
jgi:C-terminal processing protease CtpA/Prc